MTQAEIARLVEKSRSHVANLQRLLSLPECVLDHLEAGRLDMGHARALIGLDDAAELADRAVEGQAFGARCREVGAQGRKGWRRYAPSAACRATRRRTPISRPWRIISRNFSGFT